MSDSSLDDFVRAAEVLYATRLRPILEPNHLDEFVAIEPVSRTYYLGCRMSDATRQARAAFPDRRSYLMQIGHETAVQIGWFEP